MLRQSQHIHPLPNQPEARIDFSMQARAAKENKSKERLLNDNPSSVEQDFTNEDLKEYKSDIDWLSALKKDYSFGYGIYLQGPHLLGTVMVVSIQIFGEALMWQLSLIEIKSG